MFIQRTLPITCSRKVPYFIQNKLGRTVFHLTMDMYHLLTKNFAKCYNYLMNRELARSTVGKCMAFGCRGPELQSLVTLIDRVMGVKCAPSAPTGFHRQLSKLTELSTLNESCFAFTFNTTYFVLKFINS